MSVEWWWKVKIESHVCLLIACIVCLVHTHGEVATGGSAAVWTCEVLGGGFRSLPSVTEQHFGKMQATGRCCHDF